MKRGNRHSGVRSLSPSRERHYGKVDQRAILGDSLSDLEGPVDATLHRCDDDEGHPSGSVY